VTMSGRDYFLFSDPSLNLANKPDAHED